MVGSGPNGLSAAVVLARAGVRTTLVEAASTPGGGTRTEELIRAGYWHDVCSAVHPMAFASPFFKAFDIATKIPWKIPEVSFANPMDHTPAAVAYRSIEQTAQRLGADGPTYQRLLAPLVDISDELMALIMNPLLPVPSSLKALLALAPRLAWQGFAAWNRGWKGEAAPALLTGAAAHSIGRLPAPSSAAAGLVLQHLAHSVGWPVPEGGSFAIARALLDDFTAHGGTVVTGSEYTNVRMSEDCAATILDLTPKAFGRIAGPHLPQRYARALRRFSYGNAVCKVDFILNGPVPWEDPVVAQTAVVHLGGTRREYQIAEAAVAAGNHSKRPMVMVAQPSSFDSSRTPNSDHVLWAYAHVPAGSTRDVSAEIIAQIERFAPGFRDVIIDFKVATASEISNHDANYVGGDIAAGATSLWQLLARPVLSSKPWRTPIPGVYLGSSSTVPGPGVHGMSGYHAAALALRERFGLETPSLK